MGKGDHEIPNEQLFHSIYIRRGKTIDSDSDVWEIY